MSSNKVCPVEHAGVLDTNFRKLFHNPKKILKPFISEGMTVLDLGCGPGFFTIEMAKLVGNSGKVIAADLQQEMLDKLKKKVENTNLSNRIKLHKCQEDKISLSEKVDLILVFYMLHEVPNQLTFLQELKTFLKPNGKIFIVEPKFHVSKKDFQKSINMIKQSGFEIIEEPKVFFSKSVIIKIN
ncbi:MAG: methyltransferase type 11 [Spirochaetes bacterium GWD1_27_9]|nr:MAG: methyltransferase type 11 [Spirochaetes bacterium GWB1_27_13]OHD27169.1 MAG: methyltransferase type 11 [Spirochaetes bacterium GWC1_27_15]OHD30437.1 MAG: methyltransferase type 11 [Spirochaetes bacterium GWD1_27_9]